VAHSFGLQNLQKDDEILISTMEHHSNIVPWQMLCEKVGAKLKVIPINDQGELFLDEYEKLLNPKTKLVSVVHLSNSLGTINPIKNIIDQAHQVGAKVLIDGAQAVSHLRVDVQELDCDFYVFSGHKIFGPTGIGVLYAKQELLQKMPPYQGGGDMIRSVTFEKTTYNEIPHRFEAGTPNISGTIGLGAALDYMGGLDFQGLLLHEQQLLQYATDSLNRVPGLHLIGTASKKASVLSFVLDEIHPHDVGTILDQEGVCIRAGHHCTQPVMRRFGVPATVRASIAFYNTRQDIDQLVLGLHKVREIFCNE
jgi:cysteine desulfurase/selenocysteine lyase